MMNLGDVETRVTVRDSGAILARRRNSFSNDKIETNMDSNSYKIFVGLPRKNKARTGECN